jgi:bacterioferritin-associated ferredoxin
VAKGVDPASGVPAYRQIADNRLRSRITAGVTRPTDEPCGFSCGRCSRCVRAAASAVNLARYGQVDIPGGRL